MKHTIRILLALTAVILGGTGTAKADSFGLEKETTIEKAGVKLYVSAAKPSSGFAEPDAEATDITTGQWLVIKVTPTDGYWTYSDLVTVQMAGNISDAQGRTRSITLPVHPEAFSTSPDGSGFYCIQISDDYKNAKGYTKVVVGGSAIQKFNLGSPSSVSGSTYNYTSGDWTTSITVGETSFTYNGSEQKTTISNTSIVVKKGDADAVTFTTVADHVTAPVSAVAPSTLSEGKSVNAGSYNTTLTAAANGIFTSSKAVGFTIGKAPTEITIISVPDPEWGGVWQFYVGDTYALMASLAPAEAGSLVYSSSDESVATVNEYGVINAVGEGNVTITVSFPGNENYAAAVSKTIPVKVSLNAASVGVDISSVDLFVGGTHSIVVTTTPTGLNVNYTADDSGVISVDADGKITALKEGTGTITVSVGGDGVYAEKSTTITVTVTKATPTVTAPTAISGLTFTGNAQNLVSAGTTSGGTLQYALSAGGDYSAAIPQGTKAGNYTIYYKVVGDNKYKDVVEAGPVTVTIGPKALVEGSGGTLNISLSPESTVFNNSDQKPTITVKDGDTQLTLGTDYTVTYKLGADVVTETKDVNTYTVVIASKAGGNYTFTSNKTFAITKAAITSVTLDETTLTYNGSAQTVNVTSVKAGALDVPTVAYTISGNTQTTVGNYTVRVTAKDDSNFSGYAETPFSIIPEGANTFVLSGIAANYEYAGANIEPAPVVKDGEKVLIENTDYTVDYLNNKNVGQATVTVTGIGNYYGTKVVNFDITPKVLTITAKAKTITFGDAPANDGVTYSAFAGTETAADLTGTLSYIYNSKADGLGTAYIAGSNTGIYHIIPAGLTSTNYAISFVEGVLTVNAKNVKDNPGAGEGQITIELSPMVYAYDGNEKTPAVTVKDGETVISVNEYTVSYTNNVKVGTATVTITDEAGGNYTVSGKKTFVIYRAIDDLFADGNEWATFVAEEDLAVPDGLQAYVVNSVSGTTMNTEAAAYVAQGVGVLLKRTNKTVNSYRGYAYDGASAAPVSLLRGSATAATDIEAYEDYVLYNDQFELAGVRSVAKGHAYLPKTALSGAAGSRCLSISVGGNGTDPDGIDAVFSDNEETEEKWYDLNGRRLSGKPTTKGLYIKDGRKVVIK